MSVRSLQARVSRLGQSLTTGDRRRERYAQEYADLCSGARDRLIEKLERMRDGVLARDADGPQEHDLVATLAYLETMRPYLRASAEAAREQFIENRMRGWRA